MREHVVFRLYGALASWGSVVAGPVRGTYGHASRSAVLGLVAASLGVRRREESRLRALGEALEVGVCVESEGVLVRDYHTVQLPVRRRERVGDSRREILERATHLDAVLSTRDYLADLVQTLVVWERAPGGLEAAKVTGGLAGLVEALNAPVFAPYLGRRACPLSVPMEPQRVHAEHMRGALERACFASDAWLFVDAPNARPSAVLARLDPAPVYWSSACGDEGFDVRQVQQVRDVPLSRARWHFGVRDVHYGVWLRSSAAVGDGGRA